MALAFRIKDPEDFGILFSAYDEYTSILNSLFGRVLTPNDDYYTSPWCFIKNGDTSGYVVSIYKSSVIYASQFIQTMYC